MTLVKDRHLGRYSHYAGAVVKPSALGDVEVLVDGQIQPVTDEPGVHLLVRESSNLKPAVDYDNLRATTEAIFMRVDSVNGTSPPVDTRIRSQAEYDALGYDLRYMQDAIDLVRGVPLGESIIALLADGDHDIKPGSGGSWFAGSVINAGETITPAMSPMWYGSDFTNFRYVPGIHFESENLTILDAEQGGVTQPSGYEITRDAGTWTVDEHQGKLVRIDTGSGAGTIRPILTNTSTQLILGGSTTTGACTFTIYEPSARVMCAGYLLYVAWTSQNFLIVFYHVQFGTSVAPVSAWIVNTSQYVYYCILHIDASSTYVAFSSSSGLRFDVCAISLYGVNSTIKMTHARELFFWNCALIADLGSSPAITICMGLEFDCISASIIAKASHTGPLILVEGQGNIKSTYGLRLYGNGAGTLLKIDRGTCNIYSGSIYFRDCDIAVEVIATNADISTGFSPTAVNVATAWKLSKGAVVRVSSPQNLVATANDIDIDGTIHSYIDLPTDSFIVGSSGSKIVRT